MGMFDSIKLDEPLVCPACNVAHIEGLQTKSLENMLHVYRVGDTLRFGDEHDSELYIWAGWFKAYEWCKRSDSMVNFKVTVEHGLIDRIEHWYTWKRPEDLSK